MKPNMNIISTAIIAILIGLSAGYFIFGSNSNTSSGEKHSHEAESAPSTNGGKIWTCSMHPQIRQNESGDCPMCGMPLIPLEANTSKDPLVLQMTEEAIKLANIQTTTIGQTTGQKGKILRLSGKIQADERDASNLVTHIPGRVEQLYVTFEGEYVKKGQAIARIYSSEIILVQREILEAKKIKDVSPQLLEAAVNKLRYWKISPKTVDLILSSETVLESVDIYAHHSGVVTNRRVDVGDHLHMGTVLFDIQSLNRLWVLFDAYEEDLAHISLGDRIEFTTPAIPNKTFKTNVTFIDPFINPNTRIASIRTEISNSGGLLKPEMLVYGNLQRKSTNQTQLTIPKSAVLWTGTRSVVYVKVPDTTIPSYQFREVELGEGLGSSYQLISGLQNGEEVVTYGSFSIDAAAQLNNQASMMNRNVKLKGSDNSRQLPDYTESTPMEFKDQIAKVSDAYLLLKDAFVASNVNLSQTAANQVVAALTKVDMALLKGEAHLYWMEQLSALEAHSKKIISLDKMEDQRTQFDFLSQALIQTIKVFGIPKDTYYVQHCPMANDDNGADWISKEKEIRNPYFGDLMLKCGLVQETITKDYKNPSSN